MPFGDGIDEVQVDRVGDGSPTVDEVNKLTKVLLKRHFRASALENAG